MQTKEKIPIKYIMSFIFLIMLILGGTRVSAYSSPLMCIDEPAYGQPITSSTTVRGWALNPSGVKEVDILVDGQNMGTASIGLSRPDVAIAYPGYTNGSQSGYTYTLSTANLQAGSHSLVVKAVGNDDTFTSRSMSITVQKPVPLMSIDEPAYGQSITSSATVRGWALNPSGVKEVDILVDGKNMGTAAIGLSRPDVAAAYPGYTNGSQSGYTYTLSTSGILGGTHKVTVKAMGNDGSFISKDMSISVQKPVPLMSMDEPAYGQSITSSATVRGWALNPSGVKKVDILVDGQNMGTAAIGLSRPDVAAAYPGYTNGSQSGYIYTLSTANLQAGSHSLVVKAFGNDGTFTSRDMSISVQKPVPLMSIDEPAYGQSITSSATVRGWALNPSGVKEVDILVDGKNMGTAAIGLSRPDVAAAYPEYFNGSQSGYTYTLSTSGILGGTHKVTVKAIGSDDSFTTGDVSITVQKPKAYIYVDNLGNGQVLKDDINVVGWVLNPSGVKKIDMLVDGQYSGSSVTGLSRPDVDRAHPGYPGGAESGFSYILSMANIQNGRHSLAIRVQGNDDSVQEQPLYFYKGIGQTIVIDPGHNFGGDDGAYSTINGVTYVERDLNMQLADKLKTKLLNLGYNVIMTRESSDRPTVDLNTSLQNRVNVANNSDAVLFISIHHDVAGSAAPNGISAHYSTYRPNIDPNGVYYSDGVYYDATPSKAAIDSANLAQQLLDSLATLGYVNRGALDHNLFVTKNTNMTSLLLECGFITNPTEAARNADAYEQDRFAAKMAEVINNFLN
ncbi:Ig-like domain-containing protein [Clostridium sp. JN-9]|uniref:Ig-like domain-containing protein n=1 Tax=Clostridium sp. JN-9 TaxID=2507159 RepID=UPI000FFE0D5B|nr:Ig-like domain-containing protein [Clostridium sp. JN-9]QAT41036.1 N-acetylmuramoyl-L-alanine amidase [Clostridium sp. JN-9]